MSSRIICCLAALSLAACAIASPRPAGPAAAGTGGLPKGTWVEIFFETFDSVTVAADLQPLRDANLREGDREVRVWIGGGLGYPQTLHRFMVHGSRLVGEEVRYWPAPAVDSSFDGRRGHTFDALVARGQRGSCGPVRRVAGMAICRARFRSPPDWDSVLRRAEAAGLWQLPDASELPDDSRLVTDGWGITVELRSGSSYRAYDFANPDQHESPEARRATQVARAMSGIDSLARTPDEVRLFRGVTQGDYRSAFRPCGGGREWEFHDGLFSLARRAGQAVPDSSSALHYVEVVGTVTPEWLAREWESSYSHVLQVYYLVRTRPWTGRECAHPD
jgi:hypothetical protein